MVATAGIMSPIPEEIILKPLISMQPTLMWAESHSK
jgi:hypothetical protein